MAVLRPFLQTRSLVSVFHLQAKPTIIPLQKRAFIPLTIKDVDVPTLTNKSLVPIKSLATVVASLEPSASVKLSSIQNLEVNKKLLQSLTGPGSGYLDKCVQFILSQQIKVPEISLMVADKLSEVTYLTTKPYYNKEPFLEGLPKELKLGRYNPKDLSLLKKNMNTHRQLRYIEWMGVKIHDFKKVIFSTLFKLYIAGLGVLIPKRYHMLGVGPRKGGQKGQNYR